MRLKLRGRITVLCQGREMKAVVRPLRGELLGRRYGEYAQETLRLLLPYDAVIAPGNPITIQETPYVCVAARRLSGHVAADARRCAR